MEGLTIGYDGKRAVANNTGLGNYSRYVIDTLSIGFPRNIYRLYSPVLKTNSRLEPLLSRANVELVGPRSLSASKMKSLWRTFGLTRRLVDDEVSLFHGLSNELPMGIGDTAIPSVVTIHDLIYRRVPEDYNRIDRNLYDIKYGCSARAATRVIAISRRTRDDLVEDYQIDPSKIDIIYQGVDPRFSLPVSFDDRQRIKATYNLPEHFFVMVGSVRRRKNQLLAVKALECLPRELKCVIVGSNNGDYASEVDRYIAKNNLGDRVMWLTGVPFADLPGMYALADFSAYVSRYEGFGLPVVESLTVGTPVVAATGSCLEEAGGPGAVYVDPDDVEAFADAAQKLVDDHIFHEKCSSRGKQYVKRFSADEFARQTMASYRKAIIDKFL